MLANALDQLLRKSHTKMWENTSHHWWRAVLNQPVNSVIQVRSFTGPHVFLGLARGVSLSG